MGRLDDISSLKSDQKQDDFVPEGNCTQRQVNDSMRGTSKLTRIAKSRANEWTLVNSVNSTTLRAVLLSLESAGSALSDFIESVGLQKVVLKVQNDIRITTMAANDLNRAVARTTRGISRGVGDISSSLSRLPGDVTRVASMNK